MKRVGLVGLGDMGMGMAKNILKSGFLLTGYDVSNVRCSELDQAGGKPVGSCKEVGENSDTVFVMVLNGKQVKEVIFGENGLIKGLKPGSTIIISATIKPTEIIELIDPLTEKGIHLLDTPVSGGKPGAEEGTLTIMGAGKKEILDQNQDILDAVSKKVFHVGNEIGMGQTVKASLQALIGVTFAGIFESLVLGAKAGVKGEILYDVFSSSGVSSPLFKNCAKLIMERKFKDTGSQIKTMYKDLGITLDMARENGVPTFTAGSAFQLFQSGISKYPEEDNWTIVKVLEEIAETEVKW